MFKHLSKLDIVLLSTAVAVALSLSVAVEIQRNLHHAKATASPYWTEVEQREFDACMPHSLDVWKNQKSAEDYCLVNEEHKRWLSNHPEVAGRKQDSNKVTRCEHENAAKINGTRDEFRVAFDECMRRGFDTTDFQPSN